MASNVLQRHNEALRRLARSTAWHDGGRDAAFREALGIAGEVLDVRRASVWLFDDARQALHCALSLDHDQVVLETVIFHASELPAYFTALEHERVIAADDARTDPRTRELAERYLNRHGIGAMLDTPILRGGVCSGVVCHEHQNGPRHWTQAEQLFAASIADFVNGAIQIDQVRAAQAKLEEREAELRLAMEASSLGTWSWSIPDNKIFWSDAVGLIFGRSPGWRPRDYDGYTELIHPEDRESVRLAVEQAFTDGDSYFVQHRIVLENGEHRWVEGRGRLERSEEGKPSLLRGTVGDVTRQRHLELQLAHAQKMEGIGQLAGGVAHDFNNLLTAISGYAYLVYQKAHQDPELLEDMTGVMEATTRGKALTAQLLAFARQQPVNPEVVDVVDLLKRVHSLLRRVIGAQVELVTDLSDEPLRVLIDRGQLEQVLVNLAVNARDAMPEGGKLQISARRAKGGLVRIRVVDSGSGMLPEVQQRAFDPFFTTKKPGSGTGLGLAMCYGILRQAEGDIRIESSSSIGTRFVIELPERNEPPAGVPPQVDRRPVARGNETILLTEDEPAVRSVCKRTLEMHGYRVLVSSNPDEARAIAAEHDEPIALLLADVVMPRGSGPRLADELRALGKIQRVLLMSGYAFDEMNTELSPETHFLAKPFLPRQLAAKVREVIDGVSDEP
jgi:two-component system, cell cycle sensor histidine kinase and response regulator CckA